MKYLDQFKESLIPRPPDIMLGELIGDLVFNSITNPHMNMLFLLLMLKMSLWWR